MRSGGIYPEVTNRLGLSETSNSIIIQNPFTHFGIETRLSSIYNIGDI